MVRNNSFNNVNTAKRVFEIYVGPRANDKEVITFRFEMFFNIQR